jgi:capsular exopolysaccharide synthesis family protein
MIGILIGGVFAFIREAMDTSLGTIEDVEKHINSVVLGIIPHLEKDDTRDRMKFDRGPAPTADELDRFARLVTHFDPKSIGSEAYRTLRTNVASIMSKNGGKVLLVSSSMIQEGKTTSVTNLATAFAQSGQKTLLIDADLRRPSVDKTFGIVRVPGLTDLLLDTRDPRECFRTIDDIILGKYGLKLAQSTTGLEYLTILPAGRIVDKPTELLNTPALDALLADVRNKFDVILIDVSPILPVADAFVLAPKVDGVLLAYQLGRVARDVLKRTKQRVESVGGRVWGVILNDIQSEIDYRSGDFSYYHYRYDRHLDEPKTLAHRIKSMLRMKSSKPRKPAVERRPPPPPPPVQTGGTDPAGSQEVRDVMSITDDN